MKNVSKVAIMLIFMGFSALTNASSIQSSIKLDFVYESLVKQSQSLKISYIKKEHVTLCWVQRVTKGVVQKSEEVEVKHSRFIAAPLKACLPRVNAMAWLKNTDKQ